MPIEVRQVMSAARPGDLSLTARSAEALLRELAPQVLGAVVRRFGDFAAAEDAVQEALVAAALQWPRDGLPDSPRGVARPGRVAPDDRPRAQRDRAPAPRVGRGGGAARRVGLAADVGADGEQDDTLVLLFMCCHPALTPPSAIALTLRAVGGLTTAEIASAFLVPEATMAQRISRAKQSVKASGVPFRLPHRGERGGAPRAPCCTCST